MSRATALTLVALLALAVAPAGGQHADAIRYGMLRPELQEDAAGFCEGVGEPADPAEKTGYAYTLNVVEGPTPERADTSSWGVIQGPELALLTPPGRARVPENAVLYVGPATGGVAARVDREGERFVPIWPPPAPGDPTDMDGISVRLHRRAPDRRIEGRTADHYTFQAVIRNVPDGTPERQRATVVVDLWVLPDLPFSWAPFAALGARALPAMDPRLHAALASHLPELGLPARMETSVLVERIDPEGEQIVASMERGRVVFLSDLRRSDPPPRPW